MATKKSKSSNKSNKNNSTKPKETASAAKKSDIEAIKTKPEKEEPKDKKSPIESKENKGSKHGASWLSGFFARKYEEKESILTVFKNHKFYGALLGEVLGTMFLTLLILISLIAGFASTASYSFAIIAILIAVYAFSGACLNPIITAGMMASRRISVIRGVMYIIAEIIGAWLGWLIISGFRSTVPGDNLYYDIPTMTAVQEGGFWITAAFEIMGSIIIAFFFARALKYKRSVFTFASIAAGGLILATVVGYIISAALLSTNNNFVINPAIAMMMKIFPNSGADFWEILGGIFQALSLYAILPMLGGVVGFYLADFASRLSGEEQ